VSERSSSAARAVSSPPACARWRSS
jgi:hypothetical protein